MTKEDMNNLFVQDKWIVTEYSSGVTRVAQYNINDSLATEQLDWMIYPDKVEKHDEERNKVAGTLKEPYIKAAARNARRGLRIYLIRDLLNMNKFKSLGRMFMKDGVTFQQVILCGRIMSQEKKNEHYRLVIDDGTSSILCCYNQRDEDLSETPKNILIQSLKPKNIPETFDGTSLGKTVKVIGKLYEFMGKNFIFSNHIRWVTEEYYINFMEYVINSYEFKMNFATE